MTTWADQFNTYTEACEFYGADTPAGLAAEAAAYAEMEAEEAAQFVGPVVPFKACMADDGPFVMDAKLFYSMKDYYAHANLDWNLRF